jgi:AAA15 family ATPase/GTPase
MLIRFIAENFLSFNKETEFNMLTGDIRRHPSHVHKYSKIDLLKSAVIYGANGAGKSNLVNAIDCLSDIVTTGDLDLISRDLRFKLDGKTEKPSKLEVEFMVGEKGYSYGVSFKDNIVEEEWLFGLNFGAREDDMIFERKVQKKGTSKIKMASKYIKTHKDKLLLEVYEDDVLEANELFIYLVKDKKYKEIAEAFSWFETSLLIIFPGMQFADLVSHLTLDSNFKKFTNEVMNSLGTGLNELDIQTLDLENFFANDNSTERDRLLKKIKNGETEKVEGYRNAIAMLEDGKPVIKKAISYHVDAKGDKIPFELYEESSGTLRLIDFIPVLYSVNKFSATIIIDEIDQSIHPALLKAFIYKIQNDLHLKGQIIVTTHESNLLDLGLFRSDEIWFAEKNKAGESHFYPLSDFDVRPDLDIRKGYLSGRFGAIPFLGDFKELNWQDRVEN